MITVSKTKRASEFIGLLKKLSSMTTDAVVSVSNERMIIEGMDDRKVRLFHIEIPREYFDEYNVSEDTVFGLNLADIRKVRAVMKEGFKMIIDSDKIQINVFGENSIRVYVFGMEEWEDMPADTVMTPSIDYRNYAIVPTKVFVDNVKSLAKFTDRILITISGEGLLVSGGTDRRYIVLKMTTETLGDNITCVKNDDIVRAKFNLKYLLDILRILRASKKLKVSLNTDYPLRLDGDFYGYGRLVFFQAPICD